MKTSKVLFGGSHLHHMTSLDEIKRLLEQFKHISNINLPEKSHNLTFGGEAEQYCMLPSDARHC